MKNLKIYLIGLLCVAASSCEQEEMIYDGASLGHFVTTSGSYFVTETDDPGFTVHVGRTSPSGEVTYNIMVDDENSTAIEGEDFTLSTTSVTIPAGESRASFTINGIFENLTPQTQKIALIFSPENPELAGFKQNATINIQQFCPYEQNNFVGTWTATSELFADSWTVEVIAGEDESQIIAQDLYSDGRDIIIDLDDSDRTNFTASVDEQFAWVSGTYGDAYVSGEGTFSACEISVNLILDHCFEGVGCYAGYNLILEKN